MILSELGNKPNIQQEFRYISWLSLEITDNIKKKDSGTMLSLFPIVNWIQRTVLFSDWLNSNLPVTSQEAKMINIKDTEKCVNH